MRYIKFLIAFNYFFLQGCCSKSFTASCLEPGQSILERALRFAKVEDVI